MEDYEIIKNTLYKLEENNEVTEYLYTVDNYLKNDNLPMSISYNLNFLAGLIAIKNDEFDLCLPYLMKSYTNYQRIEGLILLVKYYYEMRRYLLAYSLSMVCLMTNEIPDIGCNEYVYKFEKYLVHSKICYHIQKFEEGEITLKKGY